MSSEENLRVYRGNCHCGAIIYEARLPEITSYSECNCSICRKKATQGQLNIVKGSIDELAFYSFNNGRFVHHFCHNCGTGVFARSHYNPSAVTTAINVRALQGVDAYSLDIKPFDGKALGPAYEPVAYTGAEPGDGAEGSKIYHGSCHCGAVTLAVKVKKPLETWDIAIDDERIVECNCSVCSRGAYVWIYPPSEDTVIEGREHLAYYTFNTNVVRKAFCRHCGVHVCGERNPLTDAEIEALDEGKKAFFERIQTIQPITLRVLDDFDFKTKETKRLDGWNIMKPLYTNP
ncbi:hypothetical protein Daus18300_001591 [Diaporthe australafricana]|uniref:CENP-V/GFA domain-containing protein n=1 Tax=Diaporthe australafricana TaxID=127596 RepID=A0ABR3XW29_9PEZI